MFYVESESTNSVMDVTKLVQKKLTTEEVCLQCVDCAVIEDEKRSFRYAAVIERQDEYGVLLFSAGRIPCLQSGDLILEQAIPVDSRLRCHAEAPLQKTQKEVPDFLLGLKSPDLNIILEMPQKESTQLFLAELKRAQDLNSQNSAFGSPPMFAWLDKYTQQSRLHLTTAASATTCSAPLTNTTTSASGNPFQDDVFDPLKHMNLADVNSRVVASDVTSSSKTIWFDNTFDAALPLSDSSARIRSQSRDSLDNLLDSADGTSDSLESKYAIPSQMSGGPSREKIVRKMLDAREEEFTDLKTFKLFCGTWNVNGQSPAEPLHKWMVVDAEPPDIYVIGFQELDLSKEAFLFNSDSRKEEEWQHAVKSYLHSKDKTKYKKVKSIRLVGVMLLVYIQEKHVPHVSAIMVDSVATGIMGIMGNKGGVAIRFTFHNTSLCFITSHLAAHQDEKERRNQDYRDIEAKTKFKDFEPPLTISQHDLTFWLGDLNYRIQLPINEVKACIQRGNYKKLRDNDQLVQQMRGYTDVFKGYEEGELNFNPTYKFDAGTDDYDSSEKNRIPAWCDRILWRGPNVQILRYNSHPQLKVSDHKPVSAFFNAGIRVIEPSRYKKVYEDIMKLLDKEENESLPQIKLDKMECTFKDVKFMKAQRQVVTIANVGQAPVEFEFINKLDDASFCRPWLTVTPSKAIIIQGHCCEVRVEVLVDKTTASKLNSGEEKMEDILVLHLHNGKDSFITVSGNYLTSSFGSSIEALLQMHSPIRDVPSADLLQIEKPGSLSKVDISQLGGSLYMVPKEIFKLVDFLVKNGLDTEELFLQKGRTSEFEIIRESLDTDVIHDIPDSLSVHSVAEAFLMFLECLGQPIIPYEYYTQCLASSNNFTLSKQLISSLPDCHKNVFDYIHKFLREIIKHSNNNGLTVKILSTLFGEVLLRSPIPSPPTPLPTARSKSATAKSKQLKHEEDTKKAAFMYHFISQDLD